MKIDRSNTIRITGRELKLPALKNLKRGARITARILEKIGNKEAILDIGGNRLRAEFLSGIPPKSRFSLIFEGRDSSTLIFRTARDLGDLSSLRGLLDFSIFELGDVGKNELIAIRRYLKDGIQGIFDLNRCIFKALLGKSFKEHSLTDLLNKLLKMGIQKENLIFLSYIILGNKGLNLDILISLLRFMGIEGDVIYKRFKRYSRQSDALMADIEKLSERIESLLSDEDGTELFRQLFYYISQGEDGGYRDCSGFEIPYFDSDSFRELECIYTHDGLALSLELSNLGKLDILIKFSDSDLKVSMFCGDEEVLAELKSNVDDLKSRLANLGKVVIVDFYITGEMVKKIIEINSSLVMNSIFDMRA
jgi:hypothetical protein